MIVGLTGGIATGKSLVSDYLASLSYPVIDADIIARQVVEPGRPGLTALVEHFSPNILLDTGDLDRQQLGQIIFANDKERDAVNSILHPLIRQEVEAQLKGLQDEALIVLDVPLLYEADYDSLCDQVMVVYCSPAIQVQRLMERNSLTAEEARQRIEAQIPLEEKMARADILIDNNGSRQETYAQVDRILEILL